MKRLKELRKAHGYSQQQLAEMLQTTQQTIGRWERGVVEAPQKALRDLALIFSVSVDCLMGVRPGARATTNALHLLAADNLDGFWGHIGLHLDNRPRPMWFPITAATAGRVRNVVRDGDEWLAFDTLDNRLVVVQPATARAIWLLDDACDGPEGAWEAPAHYAGQPEEVYRAFGQLTECPPAQLEALVSKLPEYDNGALVSGDPAEWERVATQVADEYFEGEASPPFLAAVVSAYKALDLKTEDDLINFLNCTTVYFCGGGEHRAWIEPARLVEFADLAESQIPETIVDFSYFGGDAELYIPSKRISAVVMPLLEVEDARGDDEDGED